MAISKIKYRAKNNMIITPKIKFLKKRLQPLKVTRPISICPVVILATNRNVKVPGRIPTLTTSTRLKNPPKAEGEPAGQK